MSRLLRNILIVFLLLSTHLAAKATIYYVKYDGTDAASGTSWAEATTLGNAINNLAKAKDEIWIQGSTDPKAAYTVPVAGYTIKSGVSLYGGFKGTETSRDQREYVGGKRYKMLYRTLLSGDIDGDDVINDANFIFPEGEATNHRGDNADHVLILDMRPANNPNGDPTVINGLTIARGHAIDILNQGESGRLGGGIYIAGDNSAANGGRFVIDQCFFLANYASKGGAIYISSEVKHKGNGNLIKNCAFFNNAAGIRTVPSNNGAGIYAQGQVRIANSVIFNNANGGINAIRPDGSNFPGPGDVMVINSTLVRNSGSGIEGLNIYVYNTVVWGNTTISSTHRPQNISHCAFIGADESVNDNVNLNTKNVHAEGPNFALPSLKTGYDSDFNILETLYPDWNWESQGETTLVDRGDDTQYNSAVYDNVDLVGAPRISGKGIDIGAYEFHAVIDSNIRYVKQGGTGDGTSWDKASGNLQRMIDDLADTGGEVWVAAGSYSPTAYQLANKIYTASFRMRDGVSVYGGFDGTEDSKNDRKKNTMSWEYTNKTILKGLDYQTPTSWGVISSSSRHVVWFAPLVTTEGETEVTFSKTTYLEGVTVMGGYALGGTDEGEFLTDRGAGIYLKGNNNTSVINCIVQNNYATGDGGGIYIDGGGRVQRCLLFNNISNGNGGAIYANGACVVRRCMLTNNQGRKGAGAYLKKVGASEDLQLSTCVVSNNTSTQNGAVYCDNGGVVVHNTIVNNVCTKSTDFADGEAAQTGGLYVDGYVRLINSVIWNNRFVSAGGTDIPMYVKNHSNETVRFRYNAISGTGNAVWNNTYQEETIFLSSKNEGTDSETGPNFSTDNANFTAVGAQTAPVWYEDGKVDYYWSPAVGSALWSVGLEQGRFPTEVQIAAETDIAGNLFSNKPSIGAHYTPEMTLEYDATADASKFILYVSPDGMDADDNGRSWERPFRSMNKAIEYFSKLTKDQVGTRTLEIRVTEGELWPRYSFVNEDAKTATISLKQMQSGATLRIVGGYHRQTDGIVVRDPMTYRSIIEGNRNDTTLVDGVYHAVTVESGAKVELDGFHIVNGYAASSATIQHGAGLLAYEGSDVTLLNCIFEDNTAVSGAAVYGEGSCKITMRNCVVNNNTNTNPSAEAVVYCEGGTGNLTLEHVSFLNNEGAAPANLGTTCFALNNTNGNSSFTMDTTGEKGAANFANPANDVGAKLGFDTYLGGYAVYRPLTSSQAASDNIINKATSGSTVSSDITTLNDRNLGGMPDLGAYEADLPENGRVIYVRQGGTGDGSSWDKAMGDVQAAVDKAYNRMMGDAAYVQTITTTESREYTFWNNALGNPRYTKEVQITHKKTTKPLVQVWVAAGTYTKSSGYTMKNNVTVYGSFPATGNPGMNERHPLLTDGIAQPEGDNAKVSDYETILQTAASLPSSNGSRVLTHKEDDCRPTESDGSDVPRNHIIYDNVRWDGFTIRHGRIGPKGGRNGGAGVNLYENVILSNCVVRDNKMSDSGNGRGGGVYCDGGVIENCYIYNNDMTGGYEMYGAGIYAIDGHIYNSVISKNDNSGADYPFGSGVFLEFAKFYNNTIVNNTGGAAIHVWTASGASASLTVYNTIVIAGTSAPLEKKDKGTKVNFYNCYLQGTTYKTGNNEADAYTTANGNILYLGSGYTAANYHPFALSLTEANEKNDYRLGNNRCVNAGREEMEGAVLPDFDMDYTNRIKDCRVDIGAYELDNSTNTTPEISENTATYYVTQNGDGDRSGSSLANAACATKLQQILKAAGDYAADNITKEVIVKVAGYEGTFTYHVTDLADENSPQSYSYKIPYGVTVMGGYNQSATDWNDKDYADNKDKNGNIKRDITKFRTVFSAIKLATVTTQEINGYHTVTFDIPETWKESDKQTIIDGVYLEDGSATSLAGGDNDDIKGGAAIVPAGAHVRNCIVQNNEAIQGGGLYVLPGGWVTGSVITKNDAEENGGGIYAQSGGSHSYFVSNTIAANTAANGGGIYVESDGDVATNKKNAAMTVNCVVWNNKANSDQNVSAKNVNEQEADAVLDDMTGVTGGDWYPFNHCYIESIELACNYQNVKMESSLDAYFANTNYELKYYSPLIDHGITKKMQDYLTANKGVAKQDILGQERLLSTEVNMDVGAFAFEGSLLDDSELLTRIFVSQHSDYVLAASEQTKKYTGKTFLTPFSWLGDALEYIRTVRAKNVKGAKSKTFEIYVAEGFYTPKYRRANADGTYDQDQRLNTFDIPYNVRIYGGFKGDEKYSSQAEDGGSDINSIEFVRGKVDFTPLTDANVKGFVDLRKGYGSDFNDNNVTEAWEMGQQTILSGNINVSDTEQNVYHVVYSEKDKNFTGTQEVLLDGVTIQDGLTLKVITAENDAPKGRGGGIYSDGVDYTIVNSRLLKNQAVRGGAAFVRNANLRIINSMVAGNKVWKPSGSYGTTKYACGGGVFVISTGSGSSSLHAVNTLWANNESEQKGGAIGADDETTSRMGVNIDLMNNTFVRNKAEMDAVLNHTYTTKDNVKLVNTLIWGNDSTKNNIGSNVDMTYSACDRDYDLGDGKTLFGPNNGFNNIFVSDVNLAVDGPRFAEPSSESGVAGFDLNNKWNSIAVSPLTDNGCGMMVPPPGTDYVDKITDENGKEVEVKQAYRDWFTNHASEYEGLYMLSADYHRYSGPNKEDGTKGNRPIDIGVYEYQYLTKFSRMDSIYVATESSGIGDGSSWQNATDDLRGALIGASNPTSNSSGTRSVYIKSGDYPWPVPTDASSVFPIYTSSKVSWENLNIVGSCTGSGHRQDFSKPTILRKHPYVTTSSYLVEIASNKNVTISGLTFSNKEGNTTEKPMHSGVNVSSNSGNLTMKNVAFRTNSSNGVNISGSTGKVLLVNALFADNVGMGLSVASDVPQTNVTLVNTTFANNGTDMTSGLQQVYNSVSWNNTIQNMPVGETTSYKLYNKVFAAGVPNEGIKTGPNFYDPLNETVDLRDYRIRPSLTLLSKGSNGWYLQHALGLKATDEFPTDERELYNEPRLVGEHVDIGAYEYRAPMQPIVYVKEGVASDRNDGSSWDRALNDLQNAANLAGIYADQFKKPAYVFVHNNMSQDGLHVQLPNIKIYGGMNDEITSQTETGAIVSDLLNQRAGLLERTDCSQLTGTIEISEESVVDGFKVTSSPTINKGILATSVVEADVTGSADGILYNTLVKGNVTDVKTVNVTATGTIDAHEGNANNRVPVTEEQKNTYVTDGDWAYQLMETDNVNIDGGSLTAEHMKTYTDMVGHDRDIAGNKRIRNTVDNGCFETWNIKNGMSDDDIVVRDDDYPHGKSVVYVRHTDGTAEEGKVYDGGAELLITKEYTATAPFNPGFLLLEHHAGLRANGKAVGLTHFAVERNIGTSDTDMTVMPFKVTEVVSELGSAAKMQLYDAAKRAENNYQYSSTDGAWGAEVTGDDYGLAGGQRTQLTTGWLLTGKGKVRFFGDNYVENAGEEKKSIVLAKQNFVEDWNTQKFTHKENMSWNLFGSPYLCAMNYKDMEYGRVMYGYQNGKYTTFNTIPETTDGYIPAGDAVFTQTATLNNEGETFAVDRPTDGNWKDGSAYQGSTEMTVALSRAYTWAEESGEEDRLLLKAVPVEESRPDFEINGDGVKWMSANMPQIYARQNGGRYSLLSAVNIEGEVSVGVSLPEAGMYTFAIPEDCNADDYETVVLKDNVTGKSVDLLEGQYDFSVAEAGDVEGRFTLSFNRMLDDKTNSVRVYSPKSYTIRVEGVSPDDVITVYATSGVVAASRIAASTTEQITVESQGVALVEVKHNGKVIVKKIRQAW